MSENITNSSIVSQCVYCRHFTPNLEQSYSSCRAYPQGIPRQILFNKVRHIFPIEGDHGIQFEPIEDDFLTPIAQKLYEKWKRAEEEERAQDNE